MCGKTDTLEQRVFLHSLDITEDLPGNTTNLCEGDTHNLKVIGEAGPDNETIKYQWYKNNNEMQNETHSSLNLQNVSAGNDGVYSCKLQTTYCTQPTKKQTIQVTVLDYQIHAKGEYKKQPVLLYCSKDDFDKYQWYYSNNNNKPDAIKLKGVVKQYYYPENYNTIFKTGYYWLEVGKYIKTQIKAQKLCRALKHSYKIKATGTKKAALYLYPNPSDGKINILLSNGNNANKSAKAKLMIWDFMGHLIISRDIGYTESIEMISVHISTPGLYSVNAFFPDGSRKTVKLLVR